MMFDPHPSPRLRRASALIAVSAILALLGACKKSSEPSSDASATPPSATTPSAPPVSSGPVGPERPPEVQQACYELGKQRCSKLACSPHAFAIENGPHLACVFRTRQVCMYEWAPAEGSATPDAIRACAKAYSSATCEQAQSGQIPACQREPGTIADGQACVFDAQCKSQFCARAADKTCGTCEAAPKEGDACKNDRCGSPALACVDQKCVAKKPKGEACTADAGCEGNLVCASGKCAAPTKAGATCDPERKTTPACDVGLTCDGESRTCKPIVAAKVGEPCGSPGTACTSDATCEDGTCVARLKLGHACKPTGAKCEAPGMCLSGYCQVPDVATCS